ncbi:MAG: ribosome biogenesis/translation initiation ATPase RLI [Candidatus Woesearchaeota archaeon]
MKRIAVVDNTKLKDMDKKKHIQSLCPVNRMGTDCIYFEGNKLLIDEATCIGCGICVKVAPEAIRVINLPEALNKEPIHRYGKNGFALYNLPIPQFGKVVGIIGSNGIGKSTALQIIAGIIKPNLGKVDDSSVNQKEIIKYFKGTEAQGFFEGLYRGEIKAAYKPQQVDLIPKQFNGTVKELLKKVDEKNEYEKVIELLELNNITDTEISEISGGELQRVAIAATVLKKANLYMFDEPTSYLDIRQRLKISNFIRGLADENTAVMVIEHDLIILDYMTDLIHLMYGKTAAYGVVSMTKTTKAGINIYLGGYLKEENIRFRDKPIIFNERAPVTDSKHSLLTVWKSMEKSFGKFKLKINDGKIFKNEIVGVLGENSIGKTSFVKILAGDIGTDNKIPLKLSYKPQYLSPNDDLVMDVLHTAVQYYDVQLIRPLELKDLLLRKLTELSGGELQRVMIAKALSEDSEIVLMDEPSAYLDVEQRLVVSKTIKEMLNITRKSAIVVDHDLLFLDYLSDRLIVFEGVPALHGEQKGPFSMEQGMNIFLKGIGLTFRRDEETHRPRANKAESQKDREQKSSGRLYYH